MLEKLTMAVWMILLCIGWHTIVWADDSLPPAERENPKATERIDLWYVSLRDRTERSSSEDFYGGLRGEMRAGTCTLEFTPIPGLKNIADAAPFYIPDERKELQHVEESTLDRFWEEIEAFVRNNSGKVVFYVHGYNVSFEKSCRRAAIFQRSLRPHHRLLLFSWPADGNLLAYTRDEADLMWSVPRIASLLHGLNRRLGSGRLDVVGHSLGARGVVLALQGIACRHPSDPLVDELVLVAPDIDTDYFSYVWPRLRHLAGHTTLYASENDEALRISHQTHGYPRLGEAGQHLTVLPGMETIDVSTVGKRRFSGHIYHLYHPEVAADLKELLTSGRPAAQRSHLQESEYNGRPYWRLIR